MFSEKRGRRWTSSGFPGGGRRLEVAKTTYAWREREGRGLIHKFIVSDGNDLYELSYKEERLAWFLEAVETDG